MRHFLFENHEYKISPQFRRARDQDSSKALMRLLRVGKHSGTKSKGSNYSTGRQAAVDSRQKCIAKMQYSNNGKAHLVQLEQYLVREGTGIDGEQASLYGTDSDEYRKNLSDRNFRIFLSPQSNKVDLTDLTKRFIIKLEAATGYKLLWQAANHYNTAHPHAHLLLNGTDKSGKLIEIPKDIVRTFMREYTRDICTSQLGRRSKKELEIEREKELRAPRYTRLDGRIKELCGGTFKINLSNVTGEEQKRILTRIDSLSKMKLCSYKEGGYKLSPRWEEDLRSNGRYNTFLKARSLLQYSNPASLKIFSGSQKQITGKVTKVYRTDGDASDNHAVILEGVDGKAYFIPLFKQPELRDGDRRGQLRDGELVTIRTYESQKGRLTPLIFKSDPERVRKEITKNKSTGRLAEELLQASSTVKPKNISQS